MPPPVDLHHDGTTIRFDPAVLPQMETRLFDTAWLRAHGHWYGSTQGRSAAHFLRFAGHEMVLRHFHRGGLMGRLNRDLYFRTRAAASRAFREFDLLRDMQAEALPVPVPVAARFAPVGAVYRADIITLRIPNALPLQALLEHQALPLAQWREIGARVRMLHDRHIHHSDLNCRNVMLDDDGRVWFIDFDKCDRRQPGAWQRANLDRLQRSLKKFAARPEGLHWNAQDWAAFLDGYGAP